MNKAVVTAFGYPGNRAADPVQEIEQAVGSNDRTKLSSGLILKMMGLVYDQIIVFGQRSGLPLQIGQHQSLVGYNDMRSFGAFAGTPREALHPLLTIFGRAKP